MSRNKSNVGMVLRQKGSSVLAAILCILIGLAVGLIALFIINPEHAWDQGFMRIIQGGFYDFPYGVGRTLTNSAPLIMTGLSVAFAFKTGLFKHRRGGPVHTGRFRRAVLRADPAPARGISACWPRRCSVRSGARSPVSLRPYLNINEVITSIMFNWIGLLYGQ